MISFRYQTSVTSDLCFDRGFNAHPAKRPVANHASILRLNYVRVTACRTDFTAVVQPPRRVLLSLRHRFGIEAFQVPQSLSEAAPLEKSEESNSPLKQVQIFDCIFVCVT